MSDWLPSRKTFSFHTIAFNCNEMVFSFCNPKHIFQVPSSEAISPLNSIREDTEDNAFFDANSVMPTLVDVDAVGEAQPRSPEGEVESKKILSVSETIVRFLLMVSLIDFIKRHLRGFSQNKLLKFQKHADEPR